MDCTKAIVRCKNGQHWQQALSLLAEAERYLLTPNVITFNASISVCERAAQWEVALILLEEVEGRDFQSDLVTYNAAISACGKAAEWQQALGLLNLVGETGLRPDTITCNSAISACEKAGEWQQALSILDEADECQKIVAKIVGARREPNETEFGDSFSVHLCQGQSMKATRNIKVHSTLSGFVSRNRCFLSKGIIPRNPVEDFYGFLHLDQHPSLGGPIRSQHSHR